MKKHQYPVIDLFAGPGGLGEGFCSLISSHDSTNRALFSLAVSVEKEATAHATLSLRSYYRSLINNNLPLNNYYAWLNGESETLTATPDENLIQKETESHTLLHELGANIEADEKLEQLILDKLKGFNKRAVLIGGPPCQAYSLVGRARNKGNNAYTAEGDHRHFLYKEYLKMVYRTEPSVFVMENVKGILSSKVNEERIFPNILKDLVAPYKALGKRSGKKYTIYSLVTNTKFQYGNDPNAIDGLDFIIRSENYGIPQKRHRVILLGVEENINITPNKLKPHPTTVNVHDVISDLPALRSRLSKGGDSPEKWATLVNQISQELTCELKRIGQPPELIQKIDHLLHNKLPYLATGSSRFNAATKESGEPLLPLHLESWYEDKYLTKVLNHESRGHIKDDLKRYLFISAYGQTFRVSPKASDFPLFLAPNHKNWHSGKFADRFRVQLYDMPSSTVTSHISKDGHYFIHPDPVQCRSFTVREAARLQTFPDNYFFMGPRTKQYVQVGNAVPPLLAHQIAQIVHNILEQSEG